MAEQAAATINRRLAARRRYARFPYYSTLGDFDFDFDFQPSIDRKLVDDLASLRFIGEKRPVVFFGPAGLRQDASRRGVGHRGWDSEVARHQRVIESIDGHLRRLKNTS
jgi:hypothetical protein